MTISVKLQRSTCATTEDDALLLDSEGEYIAGQMEGDGPPAVCSEKLQELDV